MFASWGRFVAFHRRPVAIVALLSIILSVAVMVTVAPDLSSEGFLSDNAESSRVDDTVSQQFGQGGDTLIFLFDTTGKMTDPGMQAKVETALAPVTQSGDFRQIVTTWSTGNSALISNDGASTYAIAYEKPGYSVSNGKADSLTSQVEDAAKSQGLTVETGGSLAVGSAISSQVEKGIVRAESVAIPLTIIMLLLVFGTLVAAGLPLLIGVLAILLSIGGLFVLSQEAFSSVFAINVITMLGLGLGIDYSLFMVTRFREEIARRSPEEAI
ncbi:MAG TPA: MMPL family transporter, partial [Thermomicrobiales bacterium]|nr:MMPL family transporter [Thermomicrobiales bacterium]